MRINEKAGNPKVVQLDIFEPPQENKGDDFYKRRAEAAKQFNANPEILTEVNNVWYVRGQPAKEWHEDQKKLEEGEKPDYYKGQL